MKTLSAFFSRKNPGSRKPSGPTPARFRVVRFWGSLLVTAFLAAGLSGCSAKQLKSLEKKYGKELKKLEKKYAKLLKGKKSKKKAKKAPKKAKPQVAEKSASGSKSKKGKKLIFTDDFEKGLELAQKHNRKVLVLVSLKSCPPCQAMKKSVYPQPKIKRAFRGYVVVTDPYTSGTGKSDEAYFGAAYSDLTENGYYYTPTFGVYDKQGKFIKKQSGGMNTATFAKFLK